MNWQKALCRLVARVAGSFWQVNMGRPIYSAERMCERGVASLTLSGLLFIATSATAAVGYAAAPSGLVDGMEYELTIDQLLKHGERLFLTQWTRDEGGGVDQDRCPALEPLVVLGVFDQVTSLDLPRGYQVGGK